MCRGITMSPTEYANLRELLPDIKYEMELSRLMSPDEEDYRKHVGNGIYVTVWRGKKSVDIRHFFHPSDSAYPVPTRRGIILNMDELAELQKSFDKINDEFPAFYISDGNLCDGLHSGPFETRNCAYCNPFGLAEYLL